MPPWSLWLLLAVAAYLWLRVFLHLRVIWTVDEQYNYGWAVPFLCAYLFWKRCSDGAPSSAPSPLNPNLTPTPNPTPAFKVQSSRFKVSC